MGCPGAGDHCCRCGVDTDICYFRALPDNFSIFWGTRRSGCHQGSCALWCDFCQCVYPCRGHRCAANDGLLRRLCCFCLLPYHVLLRVSGLAACILNDCGRGKPRALIYGAGDAGRELPPHCHIAM